jgi:hypothetical protein
MHGEATEVSTVIDQEDIETAVPVNALIDTIEVGLIVDTERVAREVLPLFHRAEERTDALVRSLSNYLDKPWATSAKDYWADVVAARAALDADYAEMIEDEDNREALVEDPYGMGRRHGLSILIDTLTPDVIAAKIREIDGAHDMGAGEMGELLSEWIQSAARA